MRENSENRSRNPPKAGAVEVGDRLRHDVAGVVGRFGALGEHGDQRARLLQQLPLLGSERFVHQRFMPRTASHTARVTSAVVALPPRSGVMMPAAQTCSTARISRSAAGFSPRCSSIIAPVQKLATGLAMPLPVMSKAEPWIGSNIDGLRRSGSTLPVGAMPREPASAAARSDSMSAWGGG